VECVPPACAWLVGALGCLLGCQGSTEALHGPLPSHSATAHRSSVRGVSASARPSSGSAGNTTQQSFSTAKKILLGIYADHPRTLYCGCGYRGRRIALAGCGYQPKHDSPRTARIEWEHVVPAEAFGHSFKAWREGHPDCVTHHGKRFRGRKCARKTSSEFRYIEADMYNLYPAIGEVNDARSNYSYALIAGERHPFGRCDVEIEEHKLEPRPAVRGDIARTYAYMDDAYPGRGILSRHNRALFASWAEADPVDGWECQRARRIEQVQGNRNRVLATACAAAGL